MSWFTVHDEAARRDSLSAFLAVGAFTVCALKVLVHKTSLAIWSLNITFGEIDAGIIAAFLTPCLALYWGRRYTDAVTALRNPGALADGAKQSP